MTTKQPRDEDLWETVVRGMFTTSLDRITAEFHDDPYEGYGLMEHRISTAFDQWSRRLTVVAQNQHQGTKARAAAFAFAQASLFVQEAFEWLSGRCDELEAETHALAAAHGPEQKKKPRR